MLPDEILHQLNSTFPCREAQIQQLAALYNVRAVRSLLKPNANDNRRICHRLHSSLPTG